MDGQVTYPNNRRSLDHRKERSSDFPYDTRWVNLENLVLSERGQLQKATYDMIPFLGNVQDRRICRDRNQTVVARGWGREGWRMNA